MNQIVKGALYGAGTGLCLSIGFYVAVHFAGLGGVAVYSVVLIGAILGICVATDGVRG